MPPLPMRPILGLDLEPHAALARRPPPDNVLDNLKIQGPVGVPRGAAERDDGLRVGEEEVARLRGRVGAPVVGFFSAADDGAAVEGARDDEGPGAVGGLARDGFGGRGEVCEDGLAWVVVNNVMGLKP